MKWLLIVLGLIYGLFGDHYVAKGVRRKLKSVGWQVFRDLWDRNGTLF